MTARDRQAQGAMRNGGRDISTRAIKSAVKAREGEVLTLLKINWQSGRPHIRCPYPNHDDRDPSWRWDGGKARAYCTCIDGSNSIFDVVMKVRGCDFEAAKLTVAEFIGRGDLIQSRGDKVRATQRTDPQSLLNTPATNRDDALVSNYLAHRLNISHVDVPLPSTPIAGIQRHPYFDAPSPNSRRDAKLKHVGDFPCAVFGTVAVDGRQHAHRIYLAPGGNGKADLGVTRDGKPREEKKSAKKVGSFSTAGCAVVWGKPEGVPLLVLAEGVETGAAIAHAFKLEIDGGSLAVVAAISASGIEAFSPYLVTERVIVAADRDELPNAEGEPGSKRGEQAARRFALQHFEHQSVSIALPGVSNESCDWLDIHIREGVEAVRAGILAAQAFEPTTVEVEASERQCRRMSRIQEIAKDYPLPEISGVTLAYDYIEAGRVWAHRIRHERDQEAGEEKRLARPVMTPFGISARLRRADQADTFGLRVVVQGMDGSRRNLDIDRAALAKRSIPDIMSQLYAAGLRFEADGEALVIRALKAADPQDEIVMLSRPGWHELPEERAFIFMTPGGEGIGAPEGLALELASEACMSPIIARAGNMEGWREAITPALSVLGCPHWTLGIVAPFCAAIAGLAGFETTGINFSGLTTSGKSTAQQLAVSAWSTPDPRKPGLYQSARTTINAVEALAQRAHGTLLVLDELAHIDGKETSKLIYMIAGGTGKRRMTAEAAMRGSYNWHTFAVLSCEASLREKIQQDGGKWTGGMAVRIVDIDTTDVNRRVESVALEQIAKIEHHYGHAGPAFVNALMDDGWPKKAELLRKNILDETDRLAGQEVGDSAVIRAATPFALLRIAGEMAKSFGVIPEIANVKDSVNWAWERYRQSSDAKALDPEAQAIEHLQTWITERMDVTIREIEAGTPGTERGRSSSREAVGFYNAEVVYVLKDHIRDATGKVLKETQIGSILDRRGMLADKASDGRYTVRNIPQIGRVAAYALRRSELGHSNQRANAAEPIGA